MTCSSCICATAIAKPRWPSRRRRQAARRFAARSMTLSRLGYGECFWPSPTGGQYWWIFKRTDDSIETMTMWTRGGASLWEHVFRATDSVTWLRDRLEQADF